MTDQAGGMSEARALLEAARTPYPCHSGAHLWGDNVDPAGNVLCPWCNHVTKPELIRRADRPEARVAEGLTVEALATALVAVTPTKKHGQLCPVWTRRLESKSDSPHAKRARGGPVVCDCFVARDAPMKAAAILAALPAPRPPEPDRTALVCSGCRQDVDPTKGMLVHCDACTAAALQRTLDAKAEPPAPRPPEPDRTAALVGPVTVAVVDALMAEEIGAGHYRWQVMNIVRPAIVAALAPTPDEAP
jgi:hypothetical protein